jgi:hypothetical protein
LAKIGDVSGPGHPIFTGFFLLCSAAALGQCVSVEVDEFPSSKRVGVEEIDRGRDTVLIGFDLRPDGTPIEGGAIVDSAFEGLGVHFSAVVTEGPLAGSRVSAQALHIVEAKASVSGPNILSGTDPQDGPNTSGRIAGTATIIAIFLTTEGKPARSRMVGPPTT